MSHSWSFPPPVFTRKEGSIIGVYAFLCLPTVQIPTALLRYRGKLGSVRRCIHTLKSLLSKTEQVLRTTFCIHHVHTEREEADRFNEKQLEHLKQDPMEPSLPWECYSNKSQPQLRRYGGLERRQNTRTCGIARMPLVCARPCAKALVHALIAPDPSLHFYILTSVWNIGGEDWLARFIGPCIGHNGLLTNMNLFEW